MSTETERRLAEISDRCEAAKPHLKDVLDRVIEEWDHDSSWPYDCGGCKYPDDDAECVCPGFNEFLSFVDRAPTDAAWLIDTLRESLSEVKRLRDELDEAHVEIDEVNADMDALREEIDENDGRQT